MLFIYELNSENWIGNSKLDNKKLYSLTQHQVYDGPAWAEGNEIRET